MIASSEQIVTLYEDLGVKPPEIAEALECELGAVELVLAQSSAKYRASKAIAQTGSNSNKAIGQTRLFDDEQAAEAARVLLQQMQYSEDEHIRQKAARFVIDEVKGRNDVKNIRHLTLNVNSINDQMRRAREAKAEAMAALMTNPTPGPTIDVESK